MYPPTYYIRDNTTEELTLLTPLIRTMQLRRTRRIIRELHHYYWNSI